MLTGNEAILELADDITWGITAGNDLASYTVWRLAKTMQLKAGGEPVFQLIVLLERDCELWAWTILSPGADGIVTCPLRPTNEPNAFAFRSMHIASVIALNTENRGGVLLHGALAERDGYGVILAGHSNAGKTTASQRLPSPWRSLCDDTTLVVRDQRGAYWAHPWPTWSRFMSGGPGGSWNTQRAVPLKAVFFLKQAPEDQASAVSISRASYLLFEHADQISGRMTSRMKDDEIRPLRLQRFNNSCTLAQVVPCYSLSLSLDGAFWCELERALLRVHDES